VSALAVRALEQLVLAQEPTARPQGATGRTIASDPAEVGGEPSLDAFVSGLWEGLAAHRPVACPLCGDELAPLFGAHHHPVGGRCRGCGTMLS
jgi:hypothetical protein